MTHQQQEKLPKYNEVEKTFQNYIATLNNEAITTAVNKQLQVLRSQWATGTPDFITFQTNCSKIFTTHLPVWQTPPLQILLLNFLKTLAISALTIISAGLMAMLCAEITALFGIITIAAFHFQTLTIIAGAVGALIATYNTSGMFYPRFWSDVQMKAFTNRIPTPEVNNNQNNM